MFSRQSLCIDPVAESARIEAWIADTIFNRFRRKGGVIGVSGGIDSSVTYALAVRALGVDRVVALGLPETDSETASEQLARLLVGRFGGELLVEPITPAAEGFGVYRRRNEAVRQVFPEFRDDWRMKITLPGDILGSDRLSVFTLTVIRPDGVEFARRLPVDSYLRIVAASNMKQRSRMVTLYYHAERRNYAVIGTPNVNEDCLGFFVKHGDGGVDLRPIAHLYKTQVYALAQHLGIPDEIVSRPPTTDTYSAPVSQEEFYFRLPFEEMDLLLYAWRNAVPLEEVKAAMGLTEDQVRRVYRDFEGKRRMAEYLACPALTLEPARS